MIGEITVTDNDKYIKGTVVIPDWWHENVRNNTDESNYGSECPVCHNNAVFKSPEGYFCEECLKFITPLPNDTNILSGGDTGNVEENGRGGI
jgi:hypothetical protein